jgi:hypothetical protein
MWQPNRPALRQNQRSSRHFPFIQVLRWSLFFAGLVVVSYGLYWLFAQWLVVRHISCYVEEQQIADDQCSAASALLGKSMLYTRFDDSENVREMQKVAATDQLIYFTYLRKHLPNQVRLQYAVSRPLYLVSSDQTTWAAVNDQGVLKVVSEPHQLPKVFVSKAWGSYMVNDQVVDMQTHHWILNFLNQATQLGRPIAYIGLDDKQQVSIVFEDGRRILVTGLADPTVELTRLKLIEHESAHNDRFNTVKIREIDLRFRFPVLRI